MFCEFLIDCIKQRGEYLIHSVLHDILACRLGRFRVQRSPFLNTIGMQVEVVAEVDGWLHCMATNGSKGLVPASYVTLLNADQQSKPFRTTSPTFEVCF